jgi:hypothetical protein
MTIEPGAVEPTEEERLVQQERARELARHLHELAESPSAAPGAFESFVREHDEAVPVKPA